MPKTSFPECVYLGEFNSTDYDDLPAYLPASQGGFCLIYQDSDERVANRQIENTVLCLYEELPANLLKVDIFDFANRPNFPFLNQLKHHGLSNIALNEQATTTRFNELENMVQHRLYELFNSNETNLNQYNERSTRSEPFHVLIINTAYFPHSGLSALRLKNFINVAFDAGIYVIALHNETLFYNNDSYKNNEPLKELLSSLTQIQLLSSWLAMDESILPVHKMAQFSYTFNTADINQSKVIEEVISQFETQTDDSEKDFLSVKIGTRPDGSDAYLNMGEKSMNYNAMILGMVGSGKSTLMNNIIIQIGENYHAGQIRLYLMDYKQGVEFNKFKNHPNVEKIFLKSNDVQAGIALLEQLKHDIHQRYELFKLKGVDKISAYNQVEPDYPLPFILLMVDEFHKLLKGDYRQNEYVNGLLSEVMRVGRAAGVHLLLCTQSLKGVNLDGDLKDQINLRMTYRVANDMALGFDNFDAQHIKTILDLDKYQVFVQSSAQIFTAYVDRPVEIEATIKRIRLSRPKHLQVQADIIDTKPVEQEQLVPNQPQPTTNSQAINTPRSIATTTEQTSQPIYQQAVNPIDTTETKADNEGDIQILQSMPKDINNPNTKRYNDLDIQLKEIALKHQQLLGTDDNDDDLDIPAWLSSRIKEE